jgi:hypothetical protein
MASSPTMADLKTAADTADAKLRDAQSRLEQARTEVVLASAAQHQAIVALVSDQPSAAATTNPKAKTASVPTDPLAQAAARLAAALAAYDQVRRDLGLT